MIVKQIANVIPTLNLTGVFTLVDNLLVVDVDLITNREYQFEGTAEFLYKVVELGRNKILVFLIRDGANPELTGLAEIINRTTSALNLTKDTCYLYGHYKHLNAENVTPIYVSSEQVWSTQILPYITELPMATNQFNKKFAGLFGRHNMYRLKLCKYLYENYRADSILSYNAIKATWNYRYEEYFTEDHKWFVENCPILLDFAEPQHWISFKDSLESISKWYNKYFVEVVVETDTYSNMFFTEKTLKNFFLGKPFLLFASEHSLAHLREIGYKTFEPWIDETYDKHSGFDRLQLMLNEIDRIANIPLIELQKIHQEMLPILEHNRSVFVSKR